ncbi:MAG: PAS domain S-box protein [Nitrospira sp.]
MPPKTIKKKSSLKRKTPRSPRSDRTTRKQAEEAVRSARDFLRQVINIDPHFIFAKDRGGRFTMVNQAVADAYGTTIEDLIGKTDADFNPNWTEVEFFLQMDREVMDSKKERFIPEEVITDATGKKRWLQTIKRPIIGMDGRANQVLGVSTDITEHKRAEEALRQSEERWQLAATGTTDGIWDWDVVGHTVFLSERWKQVRGYREEEIGMDETEWSSRIHPEDSSRVMATVQSYFNKEISTFDCEYRTRRKDGTYYWVSDRGIAVWDKQGRVVRMVGSETDITERKRAEQALRRLHDELEHRVAERTAELDRSNERLRAEIAERNAAEISLSESKERLQSMLDHGPNLIFMKDLQGHYVDINKQFEQTFHLTRQDIIGKSDQDIFPPEQAAAYRANDLEVLKTGRSIQFEEVAVHDDGLHTSIVWKFPLRRLDGTLYGMCGIVTDITERKEVEEALHQKQRELQQSQTQLQGLTAMLFTAQDSERQRIARDLHDDFSQRLTALVLDVTSLATHPPCVPELIGKALEPVFKELEQLTSDLHDLAYRLHPPLLRHAGLQAAIEDHLHKAIERTGLRISLKAKDLPRSIPLEWSLCLFRVFQESLQNIVKHAKATEVVVQLSGSSKGVGLSVIDNGKGFDKHDKSGHQKGLGLISMQERLRLLNGLLNIHARPADGTKVCAWIPFREQTR